MTKVINVPDETFEDEDFDSDKVGPVFDRTSCGKRMMTEYNFRETPEFMFRRLPYSKGLIRKCAERRARAVAERLARENKK